MNRGLVNLKELRNNFSNADFKHGKSSYCFIKGDKIIKIYAKKYGEDCIPKNICDLSKFSADTIVFPLEYIREDGHIVGEISKYINSESIDKSFDDFTNISSIIDNYELVINDLYLYNNIEMKDLCFVNILYSDKEGFHLIDTTEWYLTKNALKNNIVRFNSSLIDVLIDYLEIPVKYSKYYNKIDDDFSSNILRHGKVGSVLNDNFKLIMHQQYHFLELLFAYMNMYQNYYGNDMKTLEDMKKLTKVLKKG